MSEIPPAIRKKMILEIERMTKAYLNFIDGEGDFYDLGIIEDTHGVKHFFNIDKVDDNSIGTLKEVAKEYKPHLVSVIGSGRISETDDSSGETLEGIIMMTQSDNTIYTMFQVFDEDELPGNLIEFEEQFDVGFGAGQ